MTRENKLALVIGFGLLLLAGILVSDHLSAQQRVDEEPLQAVEPRWMPDQDILQFARTEAAPDPEPIREQTIAVPPRVERTIERPVAVARPPAQIVIGGSNGTVNRESAPRETRRFHYVRSGDNLSRIAEQYYGDARAWTRITRGNPEIDPDRLTIGMRLLIPAAEGTAPASAVATAPPRNRTTVVREGETLSDIARRELGDGRKWTKLHEANRATLPDPNRLKVGMVLKVPATSS